MNGFVKATVFAAVFALFASAAQPVMFGFTGNVANRGSGPGNLQVNVSVNSSCTTGAGIIYSELFAGAVSADGAFGVTLGKGGLLMADYGKSYWLCAGVDGVRLGNATEFNTGQGEISTLTPASGRTDVIGRLNVTGNANVGGNFLSTDATVTNNLAVGANALYVNAITNRVGIGTTNPRAQLNVVGNAEFTAPAGGAAAVLTLRSMDASTGYGRHSFIQWLNASGTRGAYLGWGRSANNVSPYIELGLESRHNLAVMGGNVGIGTVLPQTPLQVDGGSIRVTGYNVPTSGTGLELGMVNGIGVMFPYDRNTRVYKKMQIYGDPILLNPDGTSAVGIGTTEPRSELDVSTGKVTAGTVNVTSVTAPTTALYIDNLNTAANAQAKIFLTAGGKKWQILTNAAGSFPDHFFIYSDTFGDFPLKIKPNGETTLYNVTTTGNANIGGNFLSTDATVTNNLAVGANALHVNAITNRVGIGTSTPSDALTVVGYGSFSKGIKVPTTPANTACAGIARLKNGGANVLTSCASTSALIFLTAQDRNGTPGAVQVTGKATGRFDVNSTSATDASSVAWFIVNGAT